jgi:broad specificity polyphosphatase/5'/3'-nucleotidase SurE
MIQSNLINVLESSQTPMTISSLTRFISEEAKRTVSWNTVQKYVDELIKVDRVQAINLPHSKEENKTGLTVYTIKK